MGAPGNFRRASSGGRRSGWRQRAALQNARLGSGPKLNIGTVYHHLTIMA